MDQEEVKKSILQFLAAYTLGVISTIDIDGTKPESAVVAFTQMPDFKLIFGTSNKSRKYGNIQKNPRISFVIGWDSDIGTVQYEGVAKELEKEESKPYVHIMVKKNPRSEKFVEREDQRYFLVEPKWMRWLDMTQNPDRTFELEF